MQYEFLKQFYKRMKHIGLYSVLIQNSIQKSTWKKYGFAKLDEQINMIFALMLYIMEQSLKEEVCTNDDIAAYLDKLNLDFFQKEMSYDDCKLLADFIINVILSNEGRPMYFDCFDFDEGKYKSANISYIANRIVYIDNEVKRTSYYLTEDGYNLLLSTLEIENNMKLTIHEMIFKMHIEKQNYDKAVDEIKNIFNRMHIQLQKIQDAMNKIRRNALNYSVAEYEAINIENMNTIGETKKKFQDYREIVKQRSDELEQQNINIKKLDKKEEDMLNNLKIIESYLTKTIDEHQKILNGHFDLKSLYSKELEQITQMSLIKRFSLKTQLYDKIIENPSLIGNIDNFFRPLFHRQPEKIYNINKSLELQKPIKKKDEEPTGEILDFDEEKWQQELENKKREKLKLYETSLCVILDAALHRGQISLRQLSDMENIKEKLIPNVEIFKEIMVELIRIRHIDIDVLKKEQSENISDQSNDFELNEIILQLTASEKSGREVIRYIDILRAEGGNVVVFDNVKNDVGENKTIKCSDILIRVEKR